MSSLFCGAPSPKLSKNLSWDLRQNFRQKYTPKTAVENKRVLLKPKKFYHESSLAASREKPFFPPTISHISGDILKPLYKNPLVALMWVWPHIVGPHLANLCWPIKFMFYGKNTQRILYLQVKRGSELWVSQSLHVLKTKIERHWHCQGQLDIRLKKENQC